MSAIVQNVCKLSQNIFSTFLLKNGQKQTSTLDDANISSLKKIFSQLTLNDIYFNLNELSSSSNYEDKYLAPVTYTSLFENRFFSLTVFGFRRKTSVIPLHDHPGMHGFVKCVHGCISIKSYTILNHFEAPYEILNKVPKLEHYLVPSIYLGEDIVSSDSYQVGTLTPTERNIHEIRPLSNSAVMVDIISPPYTNFTRSHFYTIVDTVFDPKLNKNVTWLLKTLDNHEYYCDTVIYRGPNIIV